MVCANTAEGHRLALSFEVVLNDLSLERMIIGVVTMDLNTKLFGETLELMLAKESLSSAKGHLTCDVDIL